MLILSKESSESLDIIYSDIKKSVYFRAVMLTVNCIFSIYKNGSILDYIYILIFFSDFVTKRFFSI